MCKVIGVEVKPVKLHEPAPITPHEEYKIYYDKCIPLGRFLEEIQLAAIKGTIRLLKRALSHQE